MSDSSPLFPDAPVARARPATLRALGADDPPARVEIAGVPYRRAAILKHDSWAATALYEGPAGKAVCKFHRQQAIAGVPMRWLGRRMAAHEAAVHRRLTGLPLVPPLLGDVYVGGKRVPYAVARRYVAGHPLHSGERVGDRFFDELRGLLAEVHRRGVAYVDLHKRENVIVGDDGRPYLIDFQISVALPERAAWWGELACAGLWLLQQSDVYHFRKHFARHRPDLCGYAIDDVAWRRPWWIRMHRLVAVPFRTFRRRLLVTLGVRKRGGKAETEHFAEDAVRREVELRKAG